MTELLTRWSRLEPERCMIGPPTSHICASVLVGNGIHADTHAVMFDRPSAKQTALLLTAVIEAIDAREWDYRLYSSTPRPGTTHAVVWTGAARLDSRTYRPSHDAHADTPATALLAAYLDALEKEGQWCLRSSGTPRSRASSRYSYSAWTNCEERLARRPQSCRHPPVPRRPRKGERTVSHWESNKDFFRSTRRMFEELREEREAEHAAAHEAALRAERRERIAAQVLAAAVGGANFPWLTPDPMVEGALMMADKLLNALDAEEDQ